MVSVLALSLVACGGGSGSILGGGGGGLLGGAGKAPISGGSIYLNGVDTGIDTDGSGNFTLGSSVLSGYASADYPLLVELKGGTNTGDNTVYPASTTVLRGYLNEGETTVYLSALSTLMAQMIDNGTSSEEAKAAVETLFDTIAGLMGADYSNVDMDSNPTESDQFEMVQQGLLTYLGVTEQGNDSIGDALESAISDKGLTTPNAVAGEMANVASEVMANRAQIIANAEAAKNKTITTDDSLIVDKLVGLTASALLNAGDGAQIDGSNIRIDLRGGTAQVLFETVDMADDYPANGAYDGAGALVYLDVEPGSATTVCDSAGAVNLTAPTASYLTMTNASGNVNGQNNIQADFNFGGLTTAELQALAGTTLNFVFKAEADSSIKHTVKIKLYDSNTQAQITHVSIQPGFVQSDFSFGVQGNAVNIDGAAVTGVLSNGADALSADVAYAGNSETVSQLYYTRFLSPAGSKFKLGDMISSRNVDLLFNDQAYATSGTAIISSLDAKNGYTGGQWQVEIDGSDMAVGKKTFKVEVRSLADDSVVASNSQDIYFVTSASLDSIARVDNMELGDINPYTDLPNDTADELAIDNNPVFTADVHTWGTLANMRNDCSGVVLGPNDSVSIWRQGGVVADAGFFDASANGGTGAWTDHQDIVTDGVEGNGWDLTLSNGCVLDMVAAAGDKYKVHVVDGVTNRDKVLLHYENDGVSGNAHTVTSSTVSIQAD